MPPTLKVCVVQVTGTVTSDEPIVPEAGAPTVQVWFGLDGFVATATAYGEPLATVVAKDAVEFELTIEGVAAVVRGDDAATGGP